MEFPRNVLNELYELTDGNHHGMALIVLAEQMEDDGIYLGDIVQDLEDIEDERMRGGGLTSKLKDARYDIYEELVQAVYDNYDNADDVEQAL